MSRRRSRLSASVGPWAALTIMGYEKDLRRRAAQLAQNPATADVAAEIIEGIENMAAAASLVRRQSASSAPSASAQMPFERAVAGGLTSAEVADRLGLSSSRRVLQLLGEGRLEGTMVRGMWRFDEASVALEEQRRSEDRK